MPGSKSSDARALPDAAAALPGASDHLLDMAVHTMPQPGQAGQDLDDTTRTARGRWKMLVVLALCAAPVVASYFTYYVVQPTGRAGYGQLVADQPALPDLTARNLDGTVARLPALAGQWLLVSVGGGACDSGCEQHLYLQRQLRTSLGKERDRVDWVWLVDDEAPVPDRLQPALREAAVLRVPAAGIAGWLKPAPGHQLADHIYLVDPMGHWMMRFPADMDMSGAAKAKRDIDRLLRASASWDEAGR